MGGRAGSEVNAMLGSYGMDYIAEPISGTTRTNIKISDSKGVTTEINEVGPGFDSIGYNGLKDKLFENAKTTQFTDELDLDAMKTVQENLGHATAAFTLDVYGHVTAKMKQESAARMQKFFENLSA